mmetsp:Transcript_34528/g.67945  ORF Transcript_34528/g.67945 Transcript_34528/m.67945 type:complete len:166 (-) Transcript_34528:137-634(-)
MTIDAKKTEQYEVLRQVHINEDTKDGRKNWIKQLNSCTDNDLSDGLIITSVPIHKSAQVDLPTIDEADINAAHYGPISEQSHDSHSSCSSKYSLHRRDSGQSVVSLFETEADFFESENSTAKSHLRTPSDPGSLDSFLKKKQRRKLHRRSRSLHDTRSILESLEL